MTDIEMGTDRYGNIDIALEDGDLVTDGGLRTAIVLSLMCDRRAATDDTLPDGTGNRRGYWGDAYADVEGDRFGSRLWLIAREKSREEVREAAEAYAEEALGWLVEDGIAESVGVEAEDQAPDGLRLRVTVRRGGDALEQRFEYLWEEL